MTELMVEIVNVFDILERGRLRKNIVLAERQRIAADTVIIVPQQKILCFGLFFVKIFKKGFLQLDFLSHGKYTGTVEV